MKNQIWKYEITASDIVIKMPKCAKVLSVQMQNDVPYVWAQVNTEVEQVPRHFELFGTGQDMQCGGVNRVFIGTFQMDSGNLVFHLFERI